MKAYHQTEFEDFVHFADEKLKGGQLQEILAYEKHLVLGFYLKQDGVRYLVIDLNSNQPLALLFDQNPMVVKKSTKPVGLFLNSKAKNLYVQSITVQPKWGRIFFLDLKSTERECQVEVHLIPKAPNILVRADGKSIAWFKPKELVEVATPEATEVRSISHIHNEWLSQLKKPAAGAASPLQKIRKKIEKDLEKKKKALQEIEKSLASSEASDWYQLGELLKVKPIAELGREWDVYLDRKRSQTWNLEQAFQKAKSLEKKKSGTLERKKILEQEIAKLESNLDQEAEKLLRKEPALPQRKSPQEVKSRKKEFPSGIVGYLGKSAADNLKILRQSQAWDIWLHLRDYPSAHAVIHRNKNQEIGHKEIQQVALWLAQESLQKKVLLPGTRLEIIYTECRFVRPLKGDKLGRVQYQNEKHFNLIIPP